MADLVPSVLLYGQALKLIEELMQENNDGSPADTEELVARATEIITRFSKDAGKPLVNYESVTNSEPPLSKKSNRFWKAAEKDINLLQQQVDMMRAGAIFSYNTVTTGIDRARLQNERVKNKLKTLQLYSNNSDSSIISFGDSFQSLDFVDIDLIPDSEKPHLAHEGFLTLGRRPEVKNLSSSSAVRVLGSSNGFLGNNREIEDPASAPTDPESGYTHYAFRAEQNPRNDLSAILDDNPDTWLEYEDYQLDDAARLVAANFNFEYLDEQEDGSVQRVDWADGPGNNVLKLALEFDLGELESINSIEYTPFGLRDNINYPVLVRKIQTSPNGTDWTRIFPSDVWIGTDINVKVAQIADNVLANFALWIFESRVARYVRIYIEQPKHIPANVGHMYWVNHETERREEGPLPPIDDTGRFFDKDVHQDLVQFREYFEGKRWAVGIRDITINQVAHTEKSSIVTRPLRVGGVVDRVLLEDAEFEIPESYDTEQSWVKFFVSPDDGENWIEISRAEDNFKGIPEQISFNDPLPEQLREPGVLNYNTDEPVTEIRFKAELNRPSGLASTTPILKSYRLKVKRQ